MADRKDPITIQTAAVAGDAALSDESPQLRESPDVPNVGGHVDRDEETAADVVDSSKKGFFAYFLTKEFYIVVVLG
jgi:solute carrier family 35 protein F1/2